MPQLITDQRKLLKLAFSLSVDTDFLMEKIKNNPTTLDETARSQFSEGLFSFLEDAIGLDEVRQHLNSLGSIKGANAAAAIAAAKLVNLTRVSLPTLKVETSDRSSLQKIYSTLPPADSTTVAEIEPLSRSGLGDAPFQAPARLYTSSRVQSHVPLNPAANPALRSGGNRSGNGNEPKNRVAEITKQPKTVLSSVQNPIINTGRVAGLGGHCLIISNVPSTFTNISGKIFGGSLERLVQIPGSQGKSSFLVNFIDRKAAAEFLAYSKTPAGQKNLSKSSSGSYTVEWYNEGDFQNPKVLSAARLLVNPARRALAFTNLKTPWGSGRRNQLVAVLQTHDSKISAEFAIEECRAVKEKTEVYVLFRSVEAAMQVMEHHKRLLLGPDFRGCEIVFGNDPCDRLFPEAEKAALKNPAGRIMTLNKYPWASVSESEFSFRLRTLERKFSAKYSVVQYKVYPHKDQVEIVFNKTEAGVQVSEYVKKGLLGVEFMNTRAFFGSGTAHNSIPQAVISFAQDIILNGIDGTGPQISTLPAASVFPTLEARSVSIPLVVTPLPSSGPSSLLTNLFSKRDTSVVNFALTPASYATALAAPASRDSAVSTHSFGACPEGLIPTHSTNIRPGVFGRGAIAITRPSEVETQGNTSATYPVKLGGFAGMDFGGADDCDDGIL